MKILILRVVQDALIVCACLVLLGVLRGMSVRIDRLESIQSKVSTESIEPYVPVLPNIQD